MPVYVAVGETDETYTQVEEWVRLTPEVRVYWFDRESGLWLAVFPINFEPGERFRSLNADDRDGLSPGSATFVARVERSLKSAAT